VNEEDPMDELRTAERDARARELTDRLREQDVRAVAITIVDNAGVTRMKGVPLGRLAHAMEAGIGMSPVFDVFLVNDDITTSEEIGGPAGDLRLYPDPARVVALAAQPGWAWAPVDRLTQEGEPYVACQRTFARRQVTRAAAQGLELRMAFEFEWVVGSDDETGAFTAACQGPAYGMGRIVELSDYTADVLDALDQQGVQAEQLHPEYAAGQFELSIATADPVAAADLNVLVRHTIRAVSQNHGIQASFAPAVVAGSVGNGGHLHFSVWRDGTNQFASGTGPYGMTETGEAFLAGVLDSLPALCAIGAPSVSSYLRLMPSRWAGAYQCWGRENREAALRFITGAAGHRSLAANAEVKSFDLSANPYLAAGALIACGLDGVERGLRLPEEVTSDPASLSEEELARRGIARLPTSLPEALNHLDGSRVLTSALGSALYGAFRAVREGEQALFAGHAPEDVAAATRWRY
jgi:glutamine synthetase